MGHRMIERALSKVRRIIAGKLKSPVDYGEVGLRDAGLAGWFQFEAGELFKGFPIGPSDLVLDIGCGDGGMSGYCCSLGARVIAIDLDQTKIATAKHRLHAQVGSRFSIVMGSVDALPVESEAADKIICTEVLEHVDDPAKVLREMARVGKRGAHYILSVPDAASEHVLKRLAPPSAYEKPNHIRIIERNDFERMVSDAGLTIEAHAYYSFYWAVWNAIVWKCNIDFHKGRHPALDHWAKAWSAVLELPEGKAVQDALNMAMPKNQIILARKP